jgi:hypothetical protein
LGPGGAPESPPIEAWGGGEWPLSRGSGHPARPTDQGGVGCWCVVQIRCELVMLDGAAQPPIVEARFLDATGRATAIIDKEPIFADEHDLPGRGSVCGTEVGRAVVGDETIVTVSLDVPYSLETTDGRVTIAVRAADLVDGG